MSEAMNDVLNDALSNLEHDNYERSYAGYEERLADVALIRAAIEANRKRMDQRVSLMREAAMHLTNWLDMVECDCEGIGHQCGRTQVKSCRDCLLAALEQEGEQ